MNDQKNATVDSSRTQEMGYLLRWEGLLNRARIMHMYGIGPVRASQLIRSFREAQPQATKWDSRARSFLATKAAYSAAGEKTAMEGFDWYLAKAGLQPASFDSDGNGTWAAFKDFSTPCSKIFASLQRAIKARLRVELTYRSMRMPEPHTRVVEPHSLLKAGRRWHVRAYCTTNEDYRDFSLGRIVDVVMTKEQAETSAASDKAWNTAVKVILVAHPGLTESQALVVRHEYFKGTSERVETCRGALVSYIIQDLRASTDVSKQRPPDYQLAVENLAEVQKWLFPS